MVTALTERKCQFHGGRTDRDGFLVFCGKPVVKDSSYCAEHYERIYRRAPSIAAPRPPAVETADDTTEAAAMPELELERRAA